VLIRHGLDVDDQESYQEAARMRGACVKRLTPNVAT